MNADEWDMTAEEMTDEEIELHNDLCDCECYYCKAQVWCCRTWLIGYRSFSRRDDG